MAFAKEYAATAAMGESFRRLGSIENFKETISVFLT